MHKPVSVCGLRESDSFNVNRKSARISVSRSLSVYDTLKTVEGIPMTEILRFEMNVPAEVSLKHPGPGKPIEGRYGNRVMYSRLPMIA